MNITLDMYQTIAVAVIVLMAGAFLKKRISFFARNFVLPAPVIGGLLFAILTLVLYMTGVAVIDFDDTLKEVCMVFSLPQSDFRQI